MRTILVAILLVAVVYRDVIAKKDDSKCLKTLEKMHRTGICGKLNNKNECANPGMTILSQGGGLCKGYNGKFGCCYDGTYMIKKPTNPPPAPAGMPPCQNAAKQDIFILLDTAAGQSTFNDAKDAIIEFLGRPKISADQTRVGIMAVGEVSSIVSHLNQHNSRDELITVVDNIMRTTGNIQPNYDTALGLLRNQGFIASNGDDRDSVPNYAVFFVANDQKESLMPNVTAHISALKRSLTAMFSVDMTHGQTSGTIAVLFAMPPSNRYSVHANDFTGTKLADDVCAAAPRDITIPIGPVQVQACKIDLFIVIDNSTENTKDIFNAAMEALKALADVLDIHSDRIRVSICVYCKNTRIVVALGEMNTPQSLKDAIDEIVQSAMSRHDASKALNKLHKAFENEKDRKPDTEFPNVVLFVTNGRTNNHRAMVIEAGRVRQHATFFVLALPLGGGKPRLLDELSNSDGSNVFELDDGNFSVDDIKEAMC